MNGFSDHAIDALAVLRHRGISPTFSWLKQNFGNKQISENVYRSLNHGRAIIQSVDQLDQYLYSYAPMVASQWMLAAQNLSIGRDAEDNRLIDYGCG